MISKELLSEVLDLVGYIESIDISVNCKYVYYFSTYTRYPGEELRINIYELAHKCKEWAKDKKYPISSLVGSQCNSCQFPESSSGAVFYGNTEPEAIFKACQWILDNKDTK